MDTTQVDLGLDVNWNILYIECVYVWWYFYVLGNIWSSSHEKVKQHWGLVEKQTCLLKRSLYFFTISQSLIEVDEGN